MPNLFVSGAWSSEGVILLGNSIGGILRVPAAGGTAVPATTLNGGRSERFHSHPVFLPDGRHFLYLRVSGAQDRGIYIGSLDTKPEEQSMQQLVAAGYGAAYAPSSDPDTGHLLYLREGTLLAQPFDARRLRLTGDPVPVAERVLFNTGTDAYFSVSSNGVLAYRSTGGQGIRLTWFDRQGRASGNLGDAELLGGDALALAISPDGTRAATEKMEATNRDIWLLDLARGGRTRFTFHPATDLSPVWSPDGSQIVFASNRGDRGIADLYRKASSGAGEEELLLKSDQNKTPLDWSRDGRFLLYMSQDAKTIRDLWVLPMEGQRTPFPFLRTEFDERAARFSPDGRWVAYQSNETGRTEVYVQPFNAPNGAGKPVTGKWLVSRDFGGDPRWRRDGKEIFYQSLDGRVMSVEVKASVANGSPVFETGEPKALFSAPGISGWDVAPDGNRFLVYAAPSGSSSTPINVVLNWPALLKR